MPTPMREALVMKALSNKEETKALIARCASICDESSVDNLAICLALSDLLARYIAREVRRIKGPYQEIVTTLVNEFISYIHYAKELYVSNEIERKDERSQ